MKSYYTFNLNNFFTDLTKTRKDLLDSFSKSGPSFTYYSKTTVPIESKNKKNNHIDSLNEKEFDKLLETTAESIYKEKGKEMPDKQIEHVNHPSHYNDNEIETFEMFLLFYHNQPEKIQGALIFNIFKYRDRLGKKASPGDEEKMKWYLDKFELLFPDEYELYNIYHSSKKNS